MDGGYALEIVFKDQRELLTISGGLSGHRTRVCYRPKRISP